MSVCEGVIMHNFITKSPGCKYVHWRKLPVNLLEQPERLTAGTSENEEIVCPIRMHKNQKKFMAICVALKLHVRACLRPRRAQLPYPAIPGFPHTDNWDSENCDSSWRSHHMQRSQTDWLNQCIVHFEEVKVGQLSHWELVIDSEEAILWEGLLVSWRI